MISFLSETYKGNLSKDISFIQYAIYVSFFPTITSGPIDRPTEFIAQLTSKTKIKKISKECLYTSFLMILFGYFEKTVIADRLSKIVQFVYDDYESYGGLFLFFVTIIYTLQIYFDFAGYSYIARGLSKAFGFDSMENFNVPYLSRNIQEFWKRWHISLSDWLKNYIYIPLGGNRKGTLNKYINIMLTFALSGLWHGTGMSFFIWGILHGLFQVIGDITNPLKKKVALLLHIPQLIRNSIEVIITFLLVNVAWIFFAAPKGIQSAFGIINHIFISKPFNIVSFLEDISMNELLIIVVSCAIIFCIIVDVMHYKKVNVVSWYIHSNTIFKVLIFYFLIFGILVFGVYGPDFDASSFIYFNF